MLTSTDKKHWPDCAANFGRDCDMGEDCGGPEVLKEIDDLIEHVEENVGVLYGDGKPPELTGKADTIEGLRELRLKVRDLVQGRWVPVGGSEPPGLFRKYRVERLNDPTGKHDACDYFVIDRVHDKYAPIALRAYALACAAELPELARDLLADPRMVDAPPTDDGEILDELAVQGIVACEGTASPSMEWDTCALALARSHEKLRADRSQLIATLMKEREERLLPGAPAADDEVARRIVDDFADNYRCDACNARASMPEDNKADAVRALTPVLVAWLKLHTQPTALVAELKEAPPPREGFSEWLRACGVFCDDGSFNVRQATKELSDYHMLIGEVPRVYMAVSGGRLSYPNYSASTVIGLFEEEVEKACERAVADAREQWETEHAAALGAPLPLPTSTGPIPIAPGITCTVALLRSWGFETTDSGDGVANVAAGVEGARDYPHVARGVEVAHLESAALRIQEQLRQRGILLQPVGTDAPCLQASYDPASGVAILDLMNVHDGMLPPQSATSQEGR